MKEYQDDIEAILRKLTAPRRNHYYYGKMMDVMQFQMEQRYVNQKRWLMNRLLQGEGVACGLDVTAEGSQLRVTCGVALDSLGREIIVPDAFLLDPWKQLDPCGHVIGELSKDEAHTVTLSICYHECLTDYAPVLVSECETKDECRPGTVVETYRAHIDPEAPKPPASILDPKCCEGICGGTDASIDQAFSVVATIAVGGAPSAIAASADAQWVVAAGTDTPSPRAHLVSVSSNAFQTISDDRLANPIGGVTFAPSGGPALITHGRGVAIVDPSQSPAAVQKNFLEATAYGRCAAAKQGKLLFAICPGDGKVHVIDVDAQQVVDSVGIPGKPGDVAVDPDEGFVYVSSIDDGRVWRAKIDAPGSSVEEATASDFAAKTLAARAGDAGSTAYVASGDDVRTVLPDMSTGGFPSAANLVAQDSAFTRNGKGYYVVSRASEGGASEIVVYGSDDLHEVTRLPVGSLAEAVTVVPGRLRGYIANAGAGTVTVIDVPAPLTPCACSLAPCCEVEPHCVVLAAVELLPGGTIGAIETCLYRRVLYSNQLLMEMVMCLAKKVCACCGGGAPQPPPDPPPPAPLVAPRVSMLRFIGTNGGIVREVSSLAEPIKIPTNVSAILVVFTAPIAMASVTLSPASTASFTVTTPTDGPLPGSIMPQGGQAFLWMTNPLKVGKYQMHIYGTETAAGRNVIHDAAGTRLDGEPLALPSGDGTQGGDFVLDFEIYVT